MTSRYIITQNAAGHFVLSNAKTVHNVCPCCDKPICTRQAAETLARHLEEIDEGLEGVNR